MSEIKHDATSITRYVVLKDSTTGDPATGVTITTLDLQYTRNRQAPATKVDATALGATNSAFSANKAIEVDSASSPGLYRVDWPDAAFATGADKVELVVSSPTTHPAIEEIDLVTVTLADIADGTEEININMGQTVPDPGTSDTTGEALRSAINGGQDLSMLTTGFSSSNPNNLNSYLKSMMSKAATVPSGVGTYSPATDSLEAARELADLMAGSGFNTGTDSLQAIRDAIDTLVAPAIVTNSTTLSGSGFISDTVGCVRRAVDEPSTNPKYTNGDIMEFVAGAYDVIMTDINVNTDFPILVRADLAITPGKLTYTLPPHVAQVWRVGKVNSTTQLPEWEIWPGSEFSFTGRGFTLEGNTIRLLADWLTTETLQILFVPNSETFMHKGLIDETDVAADVTSTTIKFADGPTEGTLDTRPNCYAGYMIRIISSDTGKVEERICTSYDIETQIATINEAWGTTPGATADVVYEVIPQFSRLIRHIVCLRAALDILAQEGNQKRMQTLGVSYTVKLNALRRYLASKQSRFPHSMNGDTIDNSNRGWYGGELY